MPGFTPGIFIFAFFISTLRFTRPMSLMRPSQIRNDPDVDNGLASRPYPRS
jgi:hypothetical protein